MPWAIRLLVVCLHFCKLMSWHLTDMIVTISRLQKGYNGKFMRRKTCLFSRNLNGFFLRSTARLYRLLVISMTQTESCPWGFAAPIPPFANTFCVNTEAARSNRETCNDNRGDWWLLWWGTTSTRWLDLSQCSPYFHDQLEPNAALRWTKGVYDDLKNRTDRFAWNGREALFCFSVRSSARSSPADAGQIYCPRNPVLRLYIFHSQPNTHVSLLSAPN